MISSSRCTMFEKKTLVEPFVVSASGKPEDTQLYKYIFPVNVSKTTIAFIGDMYVFGGYLPVVELQARYAVQVSFSKIFSNYLV